MKETKIRESKEISEISQLNTTFFMAYDCMITEIALSPDSKKWKLNRNLKGGHWYHIFSKDSKIYCRQVRSRNNLFRTNNEITNLKVYLHSFNNGK